MQYHRDVDKLLVLVFGPRVVADALLVIATGIRRSLARFRSRPTPDQLQARYEAYLSRLLNPQPDAVERELGRLLPERLLQLYEEKSAIQSTGFQLQKPGKKRCRPERWPVYCFQPSDAQPPHALPHQNATSPVLCRA